MTCSKCLEEIVGPHVCYCLDCDSKEWHGTSISHGKPPVVREDDLRDEVAKAAMQGLLACYGHLETIEATAQSSHA